MNFIRSLRRFWLAGLLFCLGLFSIIFVAFRTSQVPALFDGERAFQDVQRQVAAGPRLMGSAAHDQVVEMIQSELGDADWELDMQTGDWQGHPITNITGMRGTQGPWIIIGAHYDSRFIADHDPDHDLRNAPVPGANDGASGVAVLLELARVLPKHLDKQVWLVFFDAEDNGRIPGWEWIIGSTQFAGSLNQCPEATVVIDMIGDADLGINYEKNSDRKIMEEIWSVAQAAGFSAEFIPTYRFSMLDDHTPFLQKGCRAVDIIDFDYPAWHTTQDTPDKVSSHSLYVVGETLRQWLLKPQ